MPTISTIFYSIDAGDWGIIDEFPYEQIFSRWWYFQSAESRGHLESVNPGSRIKCKMSVQGPEVTALSGGNKYHYSISDPISVSRWGPENNLIKQLSANSERQNNITRSGLTCRPRRCCGPSPPWRSARTAGGWWASTTAARRAGESSGPRPHTQHRRRPEAATCGTQQFNLNPDKSFQWQRKIFK